MSQPKLYDLLNEKFNNIGGILSGNLSINKDVTPGIELKSINGTSNIYKNANEDKDAGLIIRDSGASNSSAKINLSGGKTLNEIFRLSQTIDDAETFYKIYGEHNKPTAEDVGALSLSGGTIANNLVVNGILNANSLGTTLKEQTLTYTKGYIQGENLNTYTTPGRYSIASSSWATLDLNFPLASVGGFFECIGSGNTITQIYYAFTGTADYVRLFVRHYYSPNDFWSEWDELYSTYKKPTPADIGAIPIRTTYYNDGTISDALNGTDKGKLALVSLSYDTALKAALPGNNWAYVVTLQHSTGRWFQLAFGYMTSDMAIRVYTDSWQPWASVLTGNNVIHSNAKATNVDVSRIPTDSEIALETGDGGGGVSAWIWREKYQDNWGIFHDNAANALKFVGGNTERASINLSNGKITGNTVAGAIWNDYAEFRSSATIEPGRVIVETGNGTLVLATERLQPGGNIVSDTFGFSIGETENCKTPIAVSGRALAYPNEPKESYQAGDPVCTGPNGTVSKMSREEVREYPDRIIGTVSEIPEYETWGSGNVTVNNRIWIRIK